MFLKILFIVLAYFVGAIPFGFLFGKMKGVDIRTMGSNNIGATNTGRILGKKYAIFTYVLDMLKGGIFVFLFRFCIIPGEYCVLSPMLYGVVAVIGHTFPIYLGFKGGKSVACGSGAVFGYCPYLLPFMILVFFIIKKITKLVSVGSLVSTLICILMVFVASLISGDFLVEVWEYPNSALWPLNYWAVIFTFLIGVLIFVRHASNIKRILNHTEKPINY